jgi:hypothetical protein
MLIWQKSLTEGKQIGIEVTYLNTNHEFNEDAYEVCAFHPDLQVGKESGWVHVGCTGGTLLGCLAYLYDKKFINKHEYCDLEYRLQ